MTGDWKVCDCSSTSQGSKLSSVTETDSGVLLASSLVPAQTPTSANPSGDLASKGLPAPETGPVTIDLTMDDDETPPLEEFTPYRNFMISVLAVLTFHLSLQHGFTPLNTRTLVSPSSFPLSESTENTVDHKGREQILPSVPVTAPEVVTPLLMEMEVYMTSLGTLVISPHSRREPALRRLATCGLNPASLDSREVFLAPWGEWGRLCSPGDDFDNRARQRSEDKWKATVSAYLHDQGIVSTRTSECSKSVLQKAIEKGRWAQVEIWLRSGNDPSAGDLYRILWPEALLFLRETEGDKISTSSSELPAETKDIWRSIFDDPEYLKLASGKLAMLMATLDCNERPSIRERDIGSEWWHFESPVKWAEEWYKGRNEREAVIKARAEELRRKDAIRLPDQQGQIMEKDTTLDKSKARLALEHRQNASVGGVYPTPPDAIATAHSGAGPASISSTGPLDTNAFGVPGSEGMDLDWDEGGKKSEQQPTLGGEADIFGDGMDEINFITEDDFDFFDKDMDFGGDNGGGMDLDDHAMDIGVQGVENMDLGNGDMEIQMDAPQQPPPSHQTPAIDMPQPFTMPDTHKQQQQQESTSLPNLSQPNPPKNQVRTPPLSPHRVIKLLVPGYSPPSSTNGNFASPATGMKTPSTFNSHLSAPAPPKRRMSLYAPITFTDNIELADKKYAPGGRFFLADVKTETTIEDVTRIQRIRRPKKKRPGLLPAADIAHSDPLISETRIGNEQAAASESDWEYETGTESSDADDTTDDESVISRDRYFTSPLSGTQAQPGFLQIPDRKRKKADKDGDTTMQEGFSAPRSGVGTDGDVEVIGDLAPSPRVSMQPDPLDESIASAFERKVVVSESIRIGAVREQEFHPVATIVVEQMTGWMYSTWRGQPETTGDDDEDEETKLIHRRRGRDQSIVEDTIKCVFGEEAAARCDLQTFASIADSIQEPPPLPPPPPLQSSHLMGRGLPMKPNLSQRRNKEEVKEPDVFPLPPPHIRLQRGDNTLEMLPPALHFWETFGLAPISGPKNVISFCFHPAGGAMKEGAEFLLERVSASYEAGRLGQHVRAQLGDIVTNGLVPVALPVGATSCYEVGMYALITELESFAGMLSRGIADENLNIVLYVINPFPHPSSIVDISTAFHRLRQNYKASISIIPNAKQNYLALQIVPAHFVANKLGSVLRVNSMHRLAIEVYTRCHPTATQVPFTAPIHLARPLPKSIDFRLTTTPSPALLKENQALHLTYTQSLDERWVTATWTSDTADLQQTTLLNLARKNTTFLRPFSDIIASLWSTTKTLLQSPAVQHRLFITRIGTHMPEDEQQQWRSLVPAHPRVSQLVLLSVNLHPPLHLTPTSPDCAIPTFSHPVMTTTPLNSTPTPGNVRSPDPGATPPTDPIPDLDPDAELIDAADDTWGVLFSHSLPAGDAVGVMERPRCCGAVVKREGTGWRCVYIVSVVQGGGRELLREVMASWRGLAVVGRFQMGSGCREEGLPWGVRWCDVAAREVAEVL